MRPKRPDPLPAEAVVAGTTPSQGAAPTATTLTLANAVMVPTRVTPRATRIMGIACALPPPLPLMPAPKRDPPIALPCPPPSASTVVLYAALATAGFR